MKILLWEVRTEKGISLRQLERMTGISKNTINNIENGIGSPNLDKLERLAKALKVGIVDLFDSEYKYVNQADNKKKCRFKK